MKARVPRNAKMTRKEEKLLREYTKDVFRKKYLGFERRIFKAMAYALNRNYGFGKNRIKTVLIEAEKIADEYGTDEIFWDHLDRVCIDEIGIDFVREKLDENGKVMYDYDDDAKVFESEPKA